MTDIRLSTTENSPRYPWGSGSTGWHFLQRDDLSVILEESPPGETEDRHYHVRSRQFFYIVAGTATMDVDGTILTLEEGHGLEIPPGVPHRFYNASGRTVRFLAISMPKSHGDRIVVP
jgi:mannose-6-phosphate isomerase-like protein (cupin superfamily)